MADNKLIWIIVAIIAIGVMTGYIKISGIGQPEEGVTTTPVQQPGYGQLVSLSVNGIDKYSGSAIAVNGELWDSSNKQTAAETSVPSALTSLGTNFPNAFSGYVMLGNDNYESSTDRGTEYYYVKYPVSWNGIQGLITEDTINTYAEETATTTSFWTFYDDNTAETTANITVASGGTYTAAAVKMKSTASLCNGNPEFNGQHPIVWCFNETTAGMHKEIKPVINDGQVTTPGFLSGKNVVGCYYIKTDALCDGSYYTVDLYLEANSGQNPTAGTDSFYIIPLDKCYHKNDDLKWVAGYGDESELAADTDCGYASIAAALQVYEA